jgi:hypothetical protein
VSEVCRRCVRTCPDTFVASSPAAQGLVGNDVLPLARV